MKFEFVPEKEWNALPQPGPHRTPAREGAEDEEQPPPPGALVAVAAEQLRTRNRAGLSRLRTRLNRMHCAVEAARSRTQPPSTGSTPELGVEVFRPQAFRSHPAEGTHG